MKQIVKEIEGFALGYIKAPGIPTPNEWSNQGLQPSWRQLGTLTTDWYMIDELDVAGWTKDDLTMFLRAAEVQQDGFYLLNTLNNLATPGQANTEIHREFIIEWFALTSYPIDMITWYDTLFAKAASSGLTHYAPNFSEQLTSFDNVIVGALRYHQYNQNINTPEFNALQLTQSHSFGSGSASASDKLYLYRFISLPRPNDSPEIDSGSANLQIPSLRFILNADLDKEAEYQYIMRLKRSLDLYQEGL